MNTNILLSCVLNEQNQYGCEKINIDLKIKHRIKNTYLSLKK